LSKFEAKKRAQETAVKAFRQGRSALTELLELHLKDSITRDPVDKIRLICEALLCVVPVEGDPQSVLDQLDMTPLQLSQLRRIYAIALAFRKVNASSPFIAVPWPFPNDEEHYSLYIMPWHSIPVHCRWTNSTVKADKEKRLEGKPVWDSFFMVTTELDLSPVSLQELKTEFEVWAMPFALWVFARLADAYNLQLIRTVPESKEET